ncbi:MAG: thioredoxin family protein [Lentisphaeria bacterium]|nr:thioredoxin family protein [Lentisphaeria bacterium]
MVERYAKTLLALLLLSTPFFAESPFTAELSVLENNGKQYAQLTIHGPQDGHVDSESLELSLPDGFSSTLTTEMALSDSNVSSTNEPFSIYFIWTIDPPAPPAEISATFQGCTDDICYMPQTVQATIGDTPPALQKAVAAVIPDGFRVSEQLTGYHNANDFLNWIFDSFEGKTRQWNLLERVFARGGWLLACLLTIILGIALNLTPCVLPMIPITLGVLGAKSAGNGRLRGAMLGGCYGGAMALTYGLAGAIVVAFGGRFGAINSSAVFQFVLAAVFVLLALAMFNCLLIDLSRFRSLAKFNCTGGSCAAASLLGVLAALMAGACVAPVLIWVLILSTRLFADSNTAALILPFLLGIGLGLPWPLLGAGIGAMPKPGAWMNYTKKAFGIIILLFAAYTLWNGVKLLRNEKQHDDLWRSDYYAAIDEAATDKKPVLLDFWGVSCKACDLMDAKTFRNTKVLERLGDFHCVAIQADSKDNQSLADAYGIKGMPTYILLIPQ